MHTIFFWQPKKIAYGKGKAGCYFWVPAENKNWQAIAGGWVFQPF
jgi:hypothetical protein